MAEDSDRFGPPSHGLFWPLFILIVAMTIYSVYQVLDLSYQWKVAGVTLRVMDAKVQQSDLEKAKLISLANDLLRLAPKDAKAQRIVTEFKLKDLKSMDSDVAETSTETEPGTNALLEPSAPTASTNVAPVVPDSAPAK